MCTEYEDNITLKEVNLIVRNMLEEEDDSNKVFRFWGNLVSDEVKMGPSIKVSKKVKSFYLWQTAAFEESEAK